MSNEPAEVAYSTSTDGGAEPEPPRLVPALVGGATTYPPDRLSDTTLSTRARDGDVDAFEELLRAHEAELYRLAFRMLGDRHQAQEAVVATLVEGWHQLPVSPQLMSFRIWMSRTAMRHCLTMLAERPTGTGVNERAPVRAAAVGQAADPEVRADLDIALGTLSPTERACWVLKDLHGMSDTDISNAIGVTRRSIAGRVTRARHHLATSLTTV